MNSKLGNTKALVLGLTLALGASASGLAIAQTDMAGSINSEQPVADTWITTQVKSELATTDGVKSMDISVTTVNGVVELTGTQESRVAVDKAIAVAKSTKGVSRVDSSGLKIVAATATKDVAGNGSDQPVADTWITTQVKSELATTDGVKSMDISVTTVNGVVELTGTQESRVAVDKAIAVAKSTKGVSRVDASGLKIVAATPTKDVAGNGSDQPVADTWITTQVKSELATTDGVKSMDISVTTVNGVVELTGKQESRMAVEKAITVAKNTKGVSRVDSSGLKIVGMMPRDVDGSDSDQPVTDTWITTKVKADLAATEGVKSMDISVTTVNGMVELTGKQDSRMAADKAVAVAKSIKGVRSVDSSGLSVPHMTAMDYDGEHSDQPLADTWITTKVKTELATTEGVKSSDISVSTLNGVVTLIGVLDSKVAVDKATAVTRSVKGVHSVDAAGLKVR